MSGGIALLRHPLAWAGAAIVAVGLAAASLTVVPETAQGVLERMGQPVATVNGAAGHGDGAGLVAHWPFVEQVVLVDRRARSLDQQDVEVQSSDRMRLVADPGLRFRITDPARMLRTIGSETRVMETLTPVLLAALRTEAAQRPGSALYGADDRGLAQATAARIRPVAARFGADVLSVRIERAGLPPGAPLDSALERMRAARHMQAQQIAAAGDSEAAAIRAQADADAARIYAQSYGQDPEFYDFYRAMQSYRKTLGAGTSVVLSRGSDYLRQFGAAR